MELEKERKKSHKIYFAWDYDKEEKMLNEKSEQGWNLIQGGCFHSVFEKDPEKKYSYRIDFNLNLCKNEEEYLRYKEMNQELGWELINVTFNGWIFLRKEKLPGQVEEDEIYSDAPSFNAMMDRWILFGYCIISFLLIAVIGYIILGFIMKSLSILSCSLLFVIGILLLYRGIVKMKKKKIE